MLEVNSLTKTYDIFDFGPVDLTVDDEVLSILGPSGSGKTTLLSLIAGIVDPDGGSISLNGDRLNGCPLQERRTGLVFQDGALFPHMTARENIGYAATDRDRIAEFASLLEITDVLDRRPPTLSGGEQQRVALARTLAADPDLLLLDEPLASLDAPIRRRLRRELHALFTSLEIPVIYVTHDQRTATALGDRTAIVRDGAIEQVGSPMTVINRPATQFVARFTGNENLFDATVVEQREDTALLRVGNIRLQATTAAAAGTTVTLCIHPSRIQVYTPNGGDDPHDENTVSGTIDRWLTEGNEYRVEVDLDDAPITLTTTIRPPSFDQLPLETGSSVRMTIPPAAIHLLS
ncbi:ABC transporter ATP-binding protein [Natrinema limicola]|uniref:Molybdate/tungstate import ATP-binding protein WtpC n=1 Tax=Natrinema limicola JCM 13563 TaxID=1230457 RepID=M0C407_9EURY|nr:ABC transporter ATP-binding protein [Natrinema limicola]ELZ17042.1 ABC transporter ATP-binding protein [Natrinema limicola JCM 13563]